MAKPTDIIYDLRPLPSLTVKYKLIHAFFSKRRAKVLLFFGLCKFFRIKMQFLRLFSRFYRNTALQRPVSAPATSP